MPGQAALALGDVGGPVGGIILTKGLDVTGLVLAGEPLQLVKDAMPQGLEILARFCFAFMGSLVKAKSADPDLEPGILLKLAERGKAIEAGINLVGQEL